MSDSITKVQMDSMIEAWTASNSGAKVALYSNVYVPTPESQYSDFTIISHDWATPSAVVYGDSGENSDDSLTVLCQSVEFDYGTSTAAAIDTQGYLVYIPSTTTLLHARSLPGGPKNMGNSLDVLVVQPGFTLPAVPQS